ncbi:response regulator [Candidatus Berkelbacteria bacterium CG10_big_fil_rev_8_21_14_0_10_43_13]|uniref:Response regulator n=1 Tax=Candidatus Berkelbacteria bacterium CG10_big_fil_rev_8_21_14_0_10_43_13 TaxID=1974514 RepID=A0A2H0W8R2_9BACT|nr:MAG: response regulator [Candidatus Berkelbacteria bacterium CG10_big_fil_rev_8_21_14_0_10_43_13]
MFENKSILIVDDDPSLLDMYVERIKAEGAIVLEANNGEQAIKVAKEEHPQIILLDIMMPKTNGFEVLKDLKSDPDTAEIPIVILTALADDQKRRQAFTLGAADFIVKSEILPIDVVEKMRKIIAPDTELK